MPYGITTSSYDAANRHLVFGNRVATYDANENLTTLTDATGFVALAWDARNRLRTVIGPAVNARFVYDPLGRRSERTVNDVTREFAYNGIDVIAERSSDVDDHGEPGIRSPAPPRGNAPVDIQSP